MLKTVGVALVVFGLALARALGSAGTPSVPATAPASQPAKEMTLDLDGKVRMKLVQIPAGKFLMGSPETEKDREPGTLQDHDPGEVQHEVTISKPFYMGITHVTVDQFEAFIKATGQKHDDPSFNQTGDHPVVNVSWDDAQAFCRWLSKKSGRMVVLPTEAQWEYSCRAGTKTRYSFGDADSNLHDYAWYFENSIDKETGAYMTHSVGQKRPNPWGLYDMHGNAWEWCLDIHEESGTALAGDSTRAAKGGSRIVRGGSWSITPWYCRSASRMWYDSDYRQVNIGFRVVVIADGE